MADLDYEKIAEKVAEHIRDGTFARPLLDVKGLAMRLGISPRSAAGLIAGPNPKIPSFKIEGSRRVDPREVDRYVARLKESE